LLGDLTYVFDKAGNRTKVGGSWARTAIPQNVASTNYDANNRQLTFGDKTLTYDDNGNLRSITDANGTTLYSWNARNQLAAITGPNVNASFVYDGLGRRESKTVGGSLTEFLYDGVNPVQETSGATVLANILPGLRIDEFLTRTDIASGTTSSFLPDALSSPLALADSAGAVQTEYTYEPFGKTTVTGMSNTNPIQYTGRENDGTGLYYYRARYYHPGLQRFISEDPIGTPAFLACPSQRDMLLRLVTSPAGDAIEIINLYPYVRNNPIIFRDPTGLLSTSCWNNLICNMVYAVACYIVCSPFSAPTLVAPNPASITCDIICYGLTSPVCNINYPCPPPSSKSG
jgi:RHS repeat-associated protein